MNNMMQTSAFSQSTGSAVAAQPIQQMMNMNNQTVISENNLLMNNIAHGNNQSVLLIPGKNN
jgi:hypothetical protein